MSLTQEEFKEKIIEQIDEVDLIDILNLTTEDIVNAFEEKIIDYQDKIKKTLTLSLEDFDEDELED